MVFAISIESSFFLVPDRPSPEICAEHRSIRYPFSAGGIKNRSDKMVFVNALGRSAVRRLLGLSRRVSLHHFGRDDTDVDCQYVSRRAVSLLPRSPCRQTAASSLGGCRGVRSRRTLIRYCADAPRLVFACNGVSCPGVLLSLGLPNALVARNSAKPPATGRAAPCPRLD